MRSLAGALASSASAGRIRSATFAALVLVLAALPAAADEGLFLTWNDCALSAFAQHDLTSGCGQVEGMQSLVCAFRLPHAVDQVIAIEVVVDVQHADAELPPWWELAPLGCREGVLQFSPEAPPGGACVDFWQGEATGPDRPTYIVMEPYGEPNQARIYFGIAVPADQPRTLNDTDMYFAARLDLGNEKTLLCEGCQQPACLVLNSILIGRTPGAPGGDLVLSMPGPDHANWATWQGGGVDCGAVPVRRSSWGRLKSLYR